MGATTPMKSTLGQNTCGKRRATYRGKTHRASFAVSGFIHSVKPTGDTSPSRANTHCTRSQPIPTASSPRVGSSNHCEDCKEEWFMWGVTGPARLTLFSRPTPTVAKALCLCSGRGGLNCTAPDLLQGKARRSQTGAVTARQGQHNAFTPWRSAYTYWSPAAADKQPACNLHAERIQADKIHLSTPVGMVTTTASASTTTPLLVVTATGLGLASGSASAVP